MPESDRAIPAGPLAPRAADADRAGDRPPWGPASAPVAILLGLALGLASTIVVELVGQAGGSSVSHPSTAVSLLASVAFDLSFVGAALYAARMRRRPRPADFGYRLIAPHRLLAAVVVAGGVYYALSALYAGLLSLPGEKLPKELGFGGGTGEVIAAGVFVCVLAPILEEFFFRGFLFGALRQLPLRLGGRDLGPVVAAVLVAILFGLAHAGSADARYLIPLGLFGLVLCLVRWQTRSLYPCMALHSINNSLALSVALHWSVPGVIGLAIGGVAVVGACTVPLARMVN